MTKRATACPDYSGINDNPTTNNQQLTTNNYLCTMNYLLTENLSKSFGERTLFENLSFAIEQGQKIALVARNGAGKSTLLRILIGKETSDTGSVRVNKDIRMAYLPQEPELDDKMSILDCVLAGGNRMIDAVKQYEEAMDSLGEEDNTANHRKLEQATNLMDNLNAWDYEQKITQILTRLKINHLHQTIATLSGGQKKRVALAKVLIEEPDLVLMDEPTNHLDLEMVEWLEQYLKRSSLSLLLITHDRYFLDRITNEILELENGQLYRYKGNYEFYLEKKAEREENLLKEVDKSKNLMRTELEWMRRQPKARGTKSKSRIDSFYDLKDKASQKLNTQNIELNVQMSRMGNKVLEMEHVTKAFDHLKILDDFDYVFQKKERVGIVGPNGVGKTTFLELITGKQQPDSGKIDTGQTIVFGYYSQAGIKLPDDKRVIEVVTDIAEVIPLGRGETISASQFLQKFGFDPARQYTYVSKLSGGEKRRLYLLTVLVKNPNFLILDEPTNDLDIVTLTTLEDFLVNFAGCLIIVSHDRYFLDRLATHLFIFEGAGVIKDFNGTYSEYREMLQEKDKEKEKGKKIPVQPESPNTSAPRKLSFKEKREIELLELEMANLETRKNELEQKLSGGFGTPQDFAGWSKELNQIKEQLETKGERWLELSEI
jgi:ABC transport system ATP-binding/permease protein